MKRKGGMIIPEGLGVRRRKKHNKMEAEGIKEVVAAVKPHIVRLTKAVHKAWKNNPKLQGAVKEGIKRLGTHALNKGKAYLKKKLGKYMDADPTSIPATAKSSNVDVATTLNTGGRIKRKRAYRRRGKGILVSDAPLLGGPMT